MKIGLSAWKKKSGRDSPAGPAAPTAPEAAGVDAASLPDPGPGALDPPAGVDPALVAMADDAWENMSGTTLPSDAPVRGDSVVIDEPNTEPGDLYLHERVLASDITPVHIAPLERPADRRIESLERAAQSARLLVCDIQECLDMSEPLVAYALGSIVRDASRVAVELQSVLTALKKAP